jgi:DNA modification methylase
MPPTLKALANPKQTTDGSDRSCWYRFYAMFSEKFAEDVLSAACLKPGSVVLDPWLGVGTTTAVAARAGFQAVGIDINPAMVTVASGRSISKAAAVDATDSFDKATRKLKPIAVADNDPLLEWFGPSAANGLRECHRLILHLFPNQPQGAGFLLTALFEAAWKLAAPYRAKNPTWVKKPGGNERADCSVQEITESVASLARAKAAKCHAVESCPSIRLGSSANLDLPASHVDFVLTSPPYCTRIDYAVSTRIELAVLAYSDEAVSALRDATMGTSTIRSTKATAERRWGPICSDILGIIQEHSSKASASYYYKNFIQYFADLYSSLSQLNQCLKPGAGAVIVVQDSRYKGIRIDLAGIVTEMAASMRWALARRDDYDVFQTMRLVNTRSRKYRTDAASVESVLWFIAPSGV